MVAHQLFARNRARQGNARKRKKKGSKANEIIESAVKIIERKRASRCLPGRRGIQSRGTPAKNRDNGAHHEKESSFFPRLFPAAPTLTPVMGGPVRTLPVIRLTWTFVYDRTNCDLACTRLIMRQRTLLISFRVFRSRLYQLSLNLTNFFLFIKN